MTIIKNSNIIKNDKRKVGNNLNQQEQKLLLNQVRHRILQYVFHSESATAKEIGEKLQDIPQASLYRQIKLLSDSGMLKVCGERQVRGTLEHTYALSDELIAGAQGKSDLGIQFMLLSIAQDFQDYYADPGKNPDKDMISLFSSPMLMSDDEFEAYITKINELTRQYMNNTPGEGRRYRRVTFVSSPSAI